MPAGPGVRRARGGGRRRDHRPIGRYQRTVGGSCRPIGRGKGSELGQDRSVGSPYCSIGSAHQPVGQRNTPVGKRCVPIGCVQGPVRCGQRSTRRVQGPTRRSQVSAGSGQRPAWRAQCSANRRSAIWRWRHRTSGRRGVTVIGRIQIPARRRSAPGRNCGPWRCKDRARRRGWFCALHGSRRRRSTGRRGAWSACRKYLAARQNGASQSRHLFQSSRVHLINSFLLCKQDQYAWDARARAIHFPFSLPHQRNLCHRTFLRQKSLPANGLRTLPQAIQITAGCNSRMIPAWPLQIAKLPWGQYPGI